MPKIRLKIYPNVGRQLEKTDQMETKRRKRKCKYKSIKRAAQETEKSSTHPGTIRDRGSEAQRQ